MKKKCLIYGNCFCQVLSVYLKQHRYFSEIYDIDSFYTEEETPLPNFNVYDLFIYQSVKESQLRLGTDMIIEKLPLHCKKICIPSIKYGAFYPDSVTTDEFPICLKEAVIPNGNKLLDCIPKKSFNRTLLKLLLDGKPVEEILKVIQNENLYLHSVMEKNRELCYSSLKNREIKNNVDIPVADFMESNLEKKRLMYSFDHPTVFVFEYVIEKISSILNLQMDNHCINKDYMKSFFDVPVLPCVVKHFNLQESLYKGPWYIHNKKIDSLKEYVQLYYQLFHLSKFKDLPLVFPIKPRNILAIEKNVQYNVI